MQKLTAGDGDAMDHFGLVVALEGSIAVIGTDAGVAYMFTRSNGHWTQAQKFTEKNPPADSHFGAGVALSGSTVFVSDFAADIKGSDSGAVYVFKNRGAIGHRPRS